MIIFLEILSKNITDFNEKIANINQIDMDDPTISEIQSSFTLSSCSLRRPSGDEEIATVTTSTFFFIFISNLIYFWKYKLPMSLDYCFKSLDINFSRSVITLF